MKHGRGTGPIARTAVLLLLAGLVACGGEPEAAGPAEGGGTADSPEALGSALIAEVSEDLLTDGERVEPMGEPVDTSEYVREAPWTVGFTNWSSANTWTTQIDRELQEEIDRYGDQIEEYIAVSADGDANTQISQIQDMITRGVDLILVAPVNPETLVPAVEDAAAEGIPVVSFTSALPEGTPAVTNIVADQVEFGRLGGEFLMEELGCEGNIIALNGQAGVPTSDQRRQGLQEAIEACPDGGENVSVVAEQDAAWAYDQGIVATERMLAANPDVDGVWSQGGAMTQGAIDAFEAAGRPLVPMTGEDNNGFMLAWQERIPDEFRAISASEPTWQGRLALHAGLRALTGEEVNSMYRLIVPTITEDQVGDYAEPDYSDAYWTNTLLPDEIADEYYAE